MGNSTLHAIAIEELRYSNPIFYKEYCLLIEGISTQIREFAHKYENSLEYTSFTESYDQASQEPVLQVIIGINKSELYIHIYVHKDNHFVIGKSGSGSITTNSKDALKLVAQKIKQIGA